MRISPSRLVGAVVFAALAQATTPLQAQIDIVPQVIEPAPADETRPADQPGADEKPAGVATEPLGEQPAQPEAGTAGVEVGAIEAVDPEATGLFEEAEGGFGVDMWGDTPRALVAALLPRLPAGTPYGTAQSLARRLLLSVANPPTGRRSSSLLALRIERLMAMGLDDEAAALMRRLPPETASPQIDRARLDELLLAGDIPGACAAARTLIRGADDPYYDKTLAFCQAAAGRHDAASLALGLLRERGVELDAAYLALLDALAGRVPEEPITLAKPTALHIAMARAAKQPIGEDAIAGGDPAIARSIALSEATPLAVRLVAAERAEEAGALATDKLAALYAGVKFTPAAQADPLPRAMEERGPLARGLLYQTVEKRKIPAALAEALAASWTLARETGGAAGFARVARLHRSILLKLNPSIELVSVAGDVARSLLLIGRPDVAGDWLELVVRQAGVDPEATVTAARLWPLAKLGDDRGVLRWSDTRIVAWWKANADEPEADRNRRAALLYALLAALGESVPGEALVPLLDGPLMVEGAAPSPTLWQSLEQASRGGRLGETVLTALIALDQASGDLVPQVAAGVVASLFRVGLEDDARRLAVEIALAGGL